MKPKLDVAARVSMLIAAKPSGWSEAVRTHDLFEGDYGDGSERCLLNEIQLVRRVSRTSGCFECGDALQVGALCWRIKMVDSDGFYGGRVCEPCCDVIADITLRAEDEDYDPWEVLERRIASKVAVGCPSRGGEG